MDDAPAAPSGPPASGAERIEQVRLLYAGMPISLLATLLLTGVVAWSAWPVLPHGRVAIWVAAMVAVSFGRGALTLAFRRSDSVAEGVLLWDRRFLVGSLAAGLAWGGAATVLFPAGNLERQAFLAMIFAGVTAGAVTSLAARFPNLLAFALPMLVPLTLRLLWEPVAFSRVMGAMTGLYTLLILANGRRIADTIRSSIRLRLESVDREAALQRSRALLERTGRLARVGGWELDRATLALRWTSQTYAIHELPEDVDPDVDGAINFYAPEAQPVIREAVSRGLQDGTPWDLELPFITATGRRRWVRAMGEPVLENGEVVRLVGAFQDITERKQAELSLERTARTLEQLTLVTLDAEATLEETVSLVLALGLEHFGLHTAMVTRVEGETRTVLYVHGEGDDLPEPGATLPLAETFCALTMEAGQPLAVHNVAESPYADHPAHRERRVEAYLGTTISLGAEAFGTLSFASPLPRVRPFTAGDLSMIQVLGLWIGNAIQRDRILGELRRSRERFLLAVQGSGAGIWDWEIPTNKVFLSDGFKALLGYQPDEMESSFAAWEERLHPDDHDPTFDAIDRHLEGHAPFEQEFRLRTKSGDYRWFLARGQAHWAPDGQPLRMAGAIHDITERKRVERMKDEFVSTVSHELRTPLTSISGSLGLLAGGAGGELPEQAANLVAVAQRNADRLILLINDILDIERIAAGRMVFDFRVQPLMPLIEAAVDANRGYAERFEVSFEVVERVDDVRVNVDAHRLEQVLANLLSNAAKFSPKGERVEIRAARRGDSVRVEVTDRGPGIPEEFRSQVFHKFTQADGSDQRRLGGTGLGLSITKAIVEKMRGTIGFETEVGTGTTFYFELPVWEGAQPEVEHHPGEATVLVVEEDPDVANLLASVLGSAGYETRVAGSAEEAAEILDRERVDALTLDLALPGRDGAAMIADLRRDPRFARLPVVVVSAAADEGRLALGGRFALVDWLPKPIDRERLVRTLAEALPRDRDRPVVLHVEDDEPTALVVRKWGREMAEFRHAGSLEEARAQLAGDPPPDLVLLDLGLPDGSGLELLPDINRLDRSPPVVIFSAREVGPRDLARVAASIPKEGASADDLVRTLRRVMAER